MYFWTTYLSNTGISSNLLTRKMPFPWLDASGLTINV